jgi:hypothetical protein
MGRALDSSFQSEKVLFQEIDGELRRPGERLCGERAPIVFLRHDRRGEVAGLVVERSGAVTPATL